MKRSELQAELEHFPADCEIVVAICIRWEGKHTGFYKLLTETDYVCFDSIPGNGMAGVIWADINITGSGLVGSTEDVKISKGE